MKTEDDQNLIITKSLKFLQNFLKISKYFSKTKVTFPMRFCVVRILCPPIYLRSLKSMAFQIEIVNIEIETSKILI